MSQRSAELIGEVAAWPGLKGLLHPACPYPVNFKR
jgi:hypothetical protein